MSKTDKDILQFLFGSRVRIKILKLFFRNYPESFGMNTISNKIQESQDAVRKEIKGLRSIGLLANKNINERKKT